jgi:hypothetical protein
MRRTRAVLVRIQILFLQYAMTVSTILHDPVDLLIHLLLTNSRPTFRLRITASLLISSRSKHHSDLAEPVAVSPNHTREVPTIIMAAYLTCTQQTGLSLLRYRFQKVVVRSCAISRCVWLEAGSSCRYGGDDRL